MGIGTGVGARANEEEDSSSPVLVRFGQPVSFRSASGFFLRAKQRNAPAIADTEPTPFRIVNAAFREDKGPIKYGDLVLLESVDHTGLFLASNTGNTGVTLLSAALQGKDRWTVMASSRSPAGKGHGRAPRSIVSSGPLHLRSSTGHYLQVKENPSGESRCNEPMAHCPLGHALRALMELIKTIPDRSVY